MSEQMTLEQVRSGLQKLFNAGSGVACSAFPLAHWIRAIDAHLAQHAAMVSKLREDKRDIRCGHEESCVCLRPGDNECNCSAADEKPYDFADAYRGAREDLAIAKKRLIAAETKLREQSPAVDHARVNVETVREVEADLREWGEAGDAQRLVHANWLAAAIGDMK